MEALPPLSAGPSLNAVAGALVALLLGAWAVVRRGRGEKRPALPWAAPAVSPARLLRLTEPAVDPGQPWPGRRQAARLLAAAVPPRAPPTSPRR